MIQWQQFPYVRILLFYMLGISLNQFLKIEIQFDTLSLLIIVILLLLSGIGLGYLNYKFRMITGLYFGLILMLAGIFNNQHYLQPNVNFPTSGYQRFFLLITKQPTETKKSVKVIGKVFFATDNKKAESEKCILYFAKDSLALALNYGDFLQIKTRFNPINPPQNPREFNYQKYLANRKIHHQAYLKSDAWTKLETRRANLVKQFAIDLRRHLLGILQSANFSQPDFAVAAAILLGQDDILDDETRQDYAGAGAMHVLCVSGLHVGIIYLAFSLMLGFLRKKGFQQMLRTILLLFFIWLYALVTGFSPSVLRASVMLSFIILGGSLNKRGNIYNSIAASAFLLLLINPVMILEVGFQLSYAAVIGIVSIYPLLKKHIHHPNKIIDKILSILIVSIAAQIGTFPLAIYYFHQFPVYFLLTNLVVILLATLIINLGFLFLIFSLIPVLSTILKFAFGVLVNSMNSFVSWVESWPSSTLTSLVLQPIELWVIYILIITLTQSYLRRTKPWLASSLIFILLLGFSFGYRNYSRRNQANFIVYNISGQSSLEFQKGKSSSVFMDSSLMIKESKIDYHLKPNWVYAGIKNPNFIFWNEKKHQDLELGLLKDGELFSFQNQTFLRISNENLKIIKSLKAKIDYLIISNNTHVSLTEIQKQFNSKMIILDSSNSFYFERKIFEEAVKIKTQVYSVLRDGALIISLH